MPTTRPTCRGSNGNQGSKWIRPEKRRKIYRRDRHRCVWCTKDLSRVDARRRTLDHVHPRSWQRDNSAGNLITSCLRCNAKRGELSALAFAWTFPAPEAVLERVAAAVEADLPDAVAA